MLLFSLAAMYPKRDDDVDVVITYSGCVQLADENRQDEMACARARAVGDDQSHLLSPYEQFSQGRRIDGMRERFFYEARSVAAGPWETRR
jgi:hypothetical protein